MPAREPSARKKALFGLGARYVKTGSPDREDFRDHCHPSARKKALFGLGARYVKTGSPDREDFWDHCHNTAAGNGKIARRVAEAVWSMAAGS